jgi:hypothetical protein
MKIKVIIFGSTGMVGEGVLHECLLHSDVEKVLVINRRPCHVSNPKLTELIQNDFFELTTIENLLVGYNACFYCLGSTSLKMKKSEYYNITYNLTLSIAQRFSRLNPDMIFCYLSGAGADNPEKAKFMQTRVKGKIESDLLKLVFKKVYCFRPGLLKPTRGLKNAHNIYYIFTPFYPIFRRILPNFVLTLQELGIAMINSVTKGYEKQILEVRDIVNLSKL